MRGKDDGQASMLVLMSPESLVPERHPARAIKRMADECLRELSPRFDEMYARTGREDPWLIAHPSLRAVWAPLLHRVCGQMRRCASSQPMREEDEQLQAGVADAARGARRR